MLPLPLTDIGEAALNEVQTLQDVATALKVNVETVRVWKNRKKCPHLQSEPYDLDELALWRKANIKSRKDHETSSKASDLSTRKHQADIRLKTLKADHQELLNKIKTGELVHVKDTETTVINQSNAFRRELLNMENVFCDSVVGAVDAEDAKRRLHLIATDILGRLFRGDKS